MYTAENDITFDFNDMFCDNIPNGIKTQDIFHLKPLLDDAYRKVQKGRGTGMMGWTELPYRQHRVVEQILKDAQTIQKNYESFVVFGIGGSALGPAAIHMALNHLHYNALSANRRKTPRFYVEDNVDPERMGALLDVIDIQKTCFNFISKSGNTAETLAQFLVVKNLLQAALGDGWTKSLRITTDAHKGTLLKIARKEGILTYVVPEGVGGRFSVLSPVGLLPAAACGIDIPALLQGAAAMDKRCQHEDFMQNPALLGSALQYLSMEKGCNISVMMPYGDSLKLMADWYAQLWAESLGKAYNLKGERVHKGQTPVKALGVTDQHSQVQLYTQGPFDKVITFIGVKKYRMPQHIPVDYQDMPDIAFLGGHTMEELIQAEQLATQAALVKAGRLNQTITLPQVNAHTIGQLITYFYFLTAYTGELLGINTYDQPGVEEGKQATFALLGRSGYEEKRQQVQNLKKSPRWIL
jgi:glucose-6-phosphate isomerase